MSSAWWDRASDAEKKAQIEGAIEVGMTLRQCGTNLGVHHSNVRRFGLKHGLSFSRKAAPTEPKITPRRTNEEYMDARARKSRKRVSFLKRLRARYMNGDISGVFG